MFLQTNVSLGRILHVLIYVTCSCFHFSTGEMRNDLYITVERGEFEKGGKSVARNVEVTMFIVDSNGQPLKVCSFLTAVGLTTLAWLHLYL